MRVLALCVTFGINFILLFYKVKRVHLTLMTELWCSSALVLYFYISFIHAKYCKRYLS